MWLYINAQTNKDFDIRIFVRFLNEYPNILLRPYCLKMVDKVTYIKSVWITFTALFHCKQLNLKYAQQKLKIHGNFNKVCDNCIHQKMHKIVANE